MPPTSLSRSRRLLLAAAATTLTTAGLVLATGPAAWAHADLGGSSPADGQRVETSPAAVVLDLTEPVELDRTTLRLTDGSGRRIPLGRVEPTRRRALDLQGPVSLRATVPPLADGSYHLSWRTVSSDDMHQTYGTVVFGVGADAGPGATGSATTSRDALQVPGEAALRWVVFGGLALLLGGGAIAYRARRRGLPAEVAAGAWMLAARGGAVGAAAAVVLEGMLLHGSAAAAWQTRFGRAWVAHALLLAVAAVMARAAARPGSHRVVPWAVLVTAGLAVIPAALVGHPAAADGGVRLTVVTGAHLASAALWTGGTVALAVLAHRLRRATTLLVRDFARLAVPALLVSLVSGLYLAGVLVPSIGALTGSGYGRVVLGKVALVVAAAGLGAANAWVARRARARFALPARRLLAGEALVLLAVLVGAGLLGSLGPPAAPRYAATPGWRPDTAPRVAQVDDLLVAISATPNRPGENFLTVEVHSTRRPAPAPVTAVLVRVGAGAPVPAAAQGGGSWLTPARGIRSPGPVTITVRVAREQLPDVVATQTWVIAPALGTVCRRAAAAGPDPMGRADPHPGRRRGRVRSGGPRSRAGPAPFPPGAGRPAAAPHPGGARRGGARTCRADPHLARLRPGRPPLPTRLGSLVPVMPAEEGAV